MKDTIKNLIKIAEKTEDIDTQYEILQEVRKLIKDFAITINCPCNWRDIGEELAKEYDTTEYCWIYEALQLWDYTE